MSVKTDQLKLEGQRQDNHSAALRPGNRQTPSVNGKPEWMYYWRTCHERFSSAKSELHHHELVELTRSHDSGFDARLHSHFKCIIFDIKALCKLSFATWSRKIPTHCFNFLCRYLLRTQNCRTPGVRESWNDSNDWNDSNEWYLQTLDMANIRRMS